MASRSAIGSKQLSQKWWGGNAARNTLIVVELLLNIAQLQDGAEDVNEFGLVYIID
jgi:hypothetical protein